MRFFGLFRAKMTTIGIQNPKIIVTSDYQQFLSLFQIFDVKPELLSVELKVGYCWSNATMVNFWGFFGNSQTWPQTVWQGVFSDIWPMIEVKLGQILGQIMSKVTKYWLDPLIYIWVILWKAKLCFSLTWHFWIPWYEMSKCQFLL